MKQEERGTGSVFQLPNGKWCWQGSYIDETGKKKRPKRTFATRKEALDFQENQKKDIEKEKIRKERGYTVQRIYDEFLKEVESEKIKYSKNTMRCTKSNFDKHILPTFKDDILKNIKGEKLERFFYLLKNGDEKKGIPALSEKTVKNIHDDFKKLYQYAEDEKYISYNTLKALEIKFDINDDEIVNTISESEYQQVINNEENKKLYLYPVVWFLGETGLRAEELAFYETDIKSIELGKNKGNGRYVEIKKSVVREKGKGLEIIDELKTKESKRRVPLSNAAEFALATWEMHKFDLSKKVKKEVDERKQLCFRTKFNTQIDYRNILDCYHQMLENCNLEQRGLHSLRKRFIKHSLSAGVSKMEVAKMLGHSVSTMFKSYYDLDDNILADIMKKFEKSYE